MPKPAVHIPDAACQYRYVHASGPGGQHVNKTATAVELRVDLDRLGLPYGALQRLKSREKNRLNRDGHLVLSADEHRSQLMNKRAALARLEAMVAAAMVRPKRRVATRPTLASKRKRVTGKKQRGQLKANRRKPKLDS